MPWRRYPWGNDPEPDRANYDATGISATSAVGCFTAGASPYGCLDLAGNVWCWTRSCWGKYELKEGQYNVRLEYPYLYRPDDGRENLSAGIQMMRVLRGGSWGDSERYASCTSRAWYLPDDGVEFGGFRVVVSPILF